MDATLLGQIAAKCMDGLDHDVGDADAELVAVAIVAVVDNGDETLTRVYSSHERHFENLGLFTAALEVLRHGDDPDGD